jgi:glutamate/tyrosine decarboxylase-like PLP-dependent enzyme
MVAYTSTEQHQAVTKAIELIGIGRDNLRRIAVDDAFRLRIDCLAEAVERDRQKGLQPFCVIGTAGTVNTGAIDDLDAIGTYCRDERLWFHVDGAFGALAILAPALRHRLRGIALADSLAFDFHKWAHIQYDAGCVLVRDGHAHRDTFSMRPPYLHGAERALGAGAEWPCDLGPELSRGFRALRIWMAIKEHGIARFGEQIARNVRQAEYLANLIRKEPDLELLTEPTLNIICFRFNRTGCDVASLDRLNEEIVADVQESGIAVPSMTSLRGIRAIRINITNHRCRSEDLQALVRAVVDAGARRLVGEGIRGEALSPRGNP